MKHKYINSIQEVLVNDITIGFVARRSVIVGIALDIPNGWMITKRINPTLWSGNYPSRKEAREAMENYNV